MRIWLFIGGVNGLIAVMAGSYGWHALEAEGGGREIFMMGVQYQMWHALALCVVAWQAARREYVGANSFPLSKTVKLAGSCFTLGIILFSGTLYGFGAFNTILVTGAAPLGGVLLMGGWALLAILAIKPAKRENGVRRN